MTDFPDGTVDLINAQLGGFNQAMGLRFISVTSEQFTAELEVGPQHLQPYGLVHGGVLSGMIETACSTGAAVTVFAEQRSAVGLENSTSFLRAARGGTLRVTARPLVRGRRSHVWLGEVHDDQGRLLASGRVRMLILEPGAEAAGETVGHDPAPS